MPASADVPATVRRLESVFFTWIGEDPISGTPEVELDAAQARAEMPVTDIDRWLGEYKLLRIKSAWPFSTAGTPPVLPAPVTEGERLAQAVYREELSWPEAQDRLRAAHRAAGNEAEYARIQEAMARRCASC